MLHQSAGGGVIHFSLIFIPLGRTGKGIISFNKNRGVFFQYFLNDFPECSQYSCYFIKVILVALPDTKLKQYFFHVPYPRQQEITAISSMCHCMVISSTIPKANTHYQVPRGGGVWQQCVFAGLSLLLSSQSMTLYCSHTSRPCMWSPYVITVLYTQ